MDINQINNRGSNLASLSETESAKAGRLKIREDSAHAAEKSDRAEISEFARMRSSRLRVHQGNLSSANQTSLQADTANAQSVSADTDAEAKSPDAAQIPDSSKAKASDLESQLQTKKSDVKRKQEKLRNLEQQAENDPNGDDEVRKLKSKISKLKKEVNKMKAEIFQTPA